MKWMLIIVLGTAIEGEARNMIATGRTFSTEAECYMEMNELAQLPSEDRANAEFGQRITYRCFRIDAD